MKQLKLQVGKTYLSRNGSELVKIIRKVSSKPFSYIGNDGCYYTENGKWFYGCNEDPDDLIEEAPETRHTFQIPDGVKKVTVEQVGNRIVVDMVPEKEPKPGDVMVNGLGSAYIFKDVDGDGYHNYFVRLRRGQVAYNNVAIPGRPATPEEAQPLFDALKKAGKRWNAEAMKVEDVSEFTRILEWVEKHLKDGYYNHEVIAEVIGRYLKHKEGEK